MIPIQVSPGATWAILAFPVQQAGGAAGTPIAGSFYADGRGGAPNLGDRMSGWEDCRPTPCRATWGGAALMRQGCCRVATMKQISAMKSDGSCSPLCGQLLMWAIVAGFRAGDILW